MVENNYAFIYLGPLDNEDSAASPCTNHCHLTKNLSLSISKTRVAFCVLFGESRRLYFIASKQKQCFCHVGTWNHHHIKTSITLNTIPVCHSIVCQVRSMMVVLSRCILSLACMAMNKILCLKKRMSSCSLLLFYSKPNKATDQYVNAGAPQSLRQRSIFFISHVHIEEVKPLSCVAIRC